MAVGYSLCVVSQRFYFITDSRNSLPASMAAKTQLYFLPALTCSCIIVFLLFIYVHSRWLLTTDDAIVESIDSLDIQVLLHLLRAGYYLHRTSAGHIDSTVQTVKNCPMRTIYFEDPNIFPEIDRFTSETAST